MRDSGLLRNAIDTLSSLAIISAEEGDLESGIFLQETALMVCEQAKRIEIENGDENNLAMANLAISVMNETLDVLKSKRDDSDR